jgi:hypothetical protein
VACHGKADGIDLMRSGEDKLIRPETLDAEFFRDRAALCHQLAPSGTSGPLFERLRALAKSYEHRAELERDRVTQGAEVGTSRLPENELNTSFPEGQPIEAKIEPQSVPESAPREILSRFFSIVRWPARMCHKPAVNQAGYDRGVVRHRSRSCTDTCGICSVVAPLALGVRNRGRRRAGDRPQHWMA